MRHHGAQQLRGIVWSLLASILFGAIFLISGLVDASPEAVFGWRVLITVACYALALASPPGRHALGQLRAVLRAGWWTPLLLLPTAALVGVQMWLFSWSAVHGHALDASLGYLLLPIALVLVGRVAFREHVSRVQWISVSIAVVAIGLNVLATAAVSWVSFTICIGYAVYFALRRRFGLDGPATFGVEVLLLSPVAIVLVLTAPGAATSGGHLAVIAVGLAGAAAMAAYLAASRLLSMPTFGLLTYAEPVLMFVVSLILGEVLGTLQVVVFALLAAALALLSLDGFRNGARRRTRRGADAPPAS